MRQGVVFQDGPGAIIFANPSAERILGLSLDQMQGRVSIDSRWAAIHEDGAPFPGESHPAMEALRTGEPVEGVIMGVHNPVAGETSWIDVTAVPLFHGGEERPFQVYTTFQDITERRRSEAARARSEQRFRGHYDLGMVGLSISSPEKGWVDVNDRLCEMLGYTREELLAKTWYEMTHPDDLAAEVEQFERMTAGEVDCHRMEKRFMRKDGAVLHVSISVKCLRSSDGSLEEFVALIDDITERKMREQARRELEAQLAQAQKMESLGSLAGGVAHDLNNVLGAILGMATTHRNQPSVPGPMLACLDTITRACLRGRDVVHSLLRFARRDLEEERPFDVNAAVRDVVSLLSKTTLQRVHLDASLGGSLPWLQGDLSAISHALINLCVNAVDAMPDGGSLFLSTRQPPSGGVEITVRDTGTGMSPEVLARASEPFFTTKAVGIGTGLGLSIVYGTVRAHDGDVEIRSQVGQGTEVTLRFPASRIATADAGYEQPAPVSTAQVVLRVLVVDDDELVRETLIGMLEMLGHEIYSASAALAAIRLMEDGLDVDLLILDMKMPGMTGAQALPRILALRPGLDVLMVSGYASEEIDVIRRTYPRVGCLAKPFSLDELRSQMWAVWDRSRKGLLSHGPG